MVASKAIGNIVCQLMGCNARCEPRPAQFCNIKDSESSRVKL